MVLKSELLCPVDDGKSAGRLFDNSLHCVSEVMVSFERKITSFMSIARTDKSECLLIH